MFRSWVEQYTYARADPSTPSNIYYIVYLNVRKWGEPNRLEISILLFMAYIGYRHNIYVFNIETYCMASGVVW